MTRGPGRKGKTKHAAKHKARREVPKKDIREHEGVVRDMARGGAALVETDAGLVFVTGVYPGERVRLRSYEGSKRTRRGEVLERLSESPLRREAPCAHASRCGGCPWMELHEEAQQDAKKSFLADALPPWKNAEPSAIEIHSGAALGYRRRARLLFSRDAFGYRRPKTHRVVDIPDCAVLDEPLGAAYELLRERLYPALKGEGEISLARRDQRAVAWLDCQEVQPPEVFALCEDLVSDSPIAGLVLEARGVRARFGETEERILASDGKPLRLPERGFSQAHAEFDALARKVREYAEGAGRTLELFAGSGTLSVELASVVKSLTAVELDDRGVECLRENLRVRNLQAKILCSDAAEIPKGTFDLVVLDPPRAGAKESILRILEGKLPRRIIYVSCDTGTLKRDLALLEARAYRTVFARAYDLFAQTAHVESLVVLDRDRASV